MSLGSVPKAKLLIQPPQKQIIYVEPPLAVPRIIEQMVEKVVPQTMMMQVVGERVVDDKLMYQTLNTQVSRSGHAGGQGVDVKGGRGQGRHPRGAGIRYGSRPVSICGSLTRHVVCLLCGEQALPPQGYTTMQLPQGFTMQPPPGVAPNYPAIPQLQQ